MKYFFNLSKTGYVFNDHDEEGQFNSKSLLGIGRSSDKVGANVGSHDFEDGGLDVWVGKPFDMSVLDLFVPDLEGLAPDGVEDGQETRLESVLEHCYLNELIPSFI